MIEEMIERHGEQVKYIIVTKSSERRELDQLRSALAFIQTKIEKLEKKMGIASVESIPETPNPALLERVARRRREEDHA